MHALQWWPSPGRLTQLVGLLLQSNMQWGLCPSMSWILEQPGTFGQLHGRRLLTQALWLCGTAMRVAAQMDSRHFTICAPNARCRRNQRQEARHVTHGRQDRRQQPAFDSHAWGLDRLRARVRAQVYVRDRGEGEGYG